MIGERTSASREWNDGSMYQAVGLTDRGLQREANEDAFWLPEAGQLDARTLARWGALYLVVDGIGGHQAGEVASEMAATLIPRAFYAAPDADRIAALGCAIQNANMEIWQAAQRDPARAKMGATLVAALIQADRVTIAHAGDSRAYLWRRGHLQRLTEDHTWVNERRREGILTAEEAAQHPLRHLITHSLGEKPQLELSVETHVMQPGDILLLCSDGLSGVVTEAQIAQLLGDLPPEQAAPALIRAAYAAGGPDNITVILVPWKKVPDAAPAARRLQLLPAVLGVGATLLCGLGLFAMGPAFLGSSALPSAPTAMSAPPTPSAMATPFPTPTSRPVLTSLATPPPDYFEKPLYFGGSIPHHAELYLQEEPPWLNPFSKWLFPSQKLLIKVPCWSPKRPYGTILITEVGPEIWEKQTFTAGQTYTVSLKEKISGSSSSEDEKVLRDADHWQARIWGEFLSPTGLQALRIELRKKDGDPWLSVYKSTDAEKFEGWFFLAPQQVWDDLGLSLAGCTGLQDWTMAYLQWEAGKDAPIVVESYCLGDNMLP